MSSTPNATPSPSPTDNPTVPTDSDGAPIELSIIAPAHNEQDNIAGLVTDVHEALTPTGLGFELIIVNDGSTDQTEARILEQMADHPWLHAVRLAGATPGKGLGPSAGFHAGIRSARGRLIAFLDADRQNDPADLPGMIDMLREQRVDMVQGDRSHDRRDNVVRRVSSWVGRTFRRVCLGDPIRDTACALRVFKREIGSALPLQFAGLHRFIPFYTRLLGYKVAEYRTNHRPRVAGEAKYGVRNRAIPALVDLIAVRWMRNRLRPMDWEAVEPDKAGPSDREGSA